MAFAAPAVFGVLRRVHTVLIVRGACRSAASAVRARLFGVETFQRMRLQAKASSVFACCCCLMRFRLRRTSRREHRLMMLADQCRLLPHQVHYSRQALTAESLR